MRKTAMTALLLLSSLSMTESALAVTYEGCFVCSYEFLTGISEICDQVGNGETGGGWKCYETYDLTGSKCRLDGGPCYNITVNGNGGGGGGGGDDNTCAERGPGGVCPAECFSCGGGGGGGIVTY